MGQRPPQDSVTLTPSARKVLQSMRAEWSKKSILSAALLAFSRLPYRKQREFIRLANQDKDQ